MPLVVQKTNRRVALCLVGLLFFTCSFLCIHADIAAVVASNADTLSGVLKRVTERMDYVMNAPVQAVQLMSSFHDNEGFSPGGLHAAGRDRIFAYLFSLKGSFHGVKVYFGTELGEYFAMFDTEAVYREPGNSGYAADNSSKYWPVCLNPDNGTKQNCKMAVNDSYVQCVDNCSLVPCAVGNVSYSGNCTNVNETCNDLNIINWCSDYTIQQAQENETLGFVPTGYHCFDGHGKFSQEPGKVMSGYDLVRVEGEYVGSYYPNGTCVYANQKPVSGFMEGAFAYCNGKVCNDTFTGRIRTIDYDPRVRPWYTDTKQLQKPSWSKPYPFATYSNIITKIGITYANPFYDTQSNGNKVFAGVYAVDYTLYDISTFLRENYGGAQDTVVTVLEMAEPYYLIGCSTGTSPYKQVLAANESLPCPNGKDCSTVRVLATDMKPADSQNGTSVTHFASRAVQAQVAAGFPAGRTVIVKATDEIFTQQFTCQSINYTQAGTDLKWVVVVFSSLLRPSSDTLQTANTLYVFFLLVAAAGTLGCMVLFFLWYKNRKEQAVMQGDFFFTGAFIVGCILLNLASFTSLGENTNAMCMTRFWVRNLTLSLAIAPLLVKVYRVYMIVGHEDWRRRTFTPQQAVMYTLPIIAVEVIILLVFTFVDPSRAVESYNLGLPVPELHIRCGSSTNAAFLTETIYQSTLIFIGCVLSFKSRNLDTRFGESKQLLFGMYNIAVTGICFILLETCVDVTPSALSMFRAIGVLWGTVLTCAVFVLPRLIQTRDIRRNSERRRSSVRITGLHDISSEPYSERRGTVATLGDEKVSDDEHVIEFYEDTETPAGAQSQTTGDVPVEQSAKT
jgi:hypothetical protein